MAIQTYGVVAADVTAEHFSSMVDAPAALLTASITTAAVELNQRLRQVGMDPTAWISTTPEEDFRRAADLVKLGAAAKAVAAMGHDGLDWAKTIMARWRTALDEVIGHPQRWSSYARGTQGMTLRSHVSDAATTTIPSDRQRWSSTRYQF